MYEKQLNEVFYVTAFIARFLIFSLLFLKYFPKMKVGLSNQQSVCLYEYIRVSMSLSVCPPPITFEPLSTFS
jgi:hypothetical protein